MATSSSTAMINVTPPTKKPTGLDLKRSGQKFSATWKIGDADYGDGQSFQYRLGSNSLGGWTSRSISKKATSEAFSIDYDDFYPSTRTVSGKTKTMPKLGTISFRVRGNRSKYNKTQGSGNNKTTFTINPTVSDWSTHVFRFVKPSKPKVSEELDSTLVNVVVFKWTVTNEKTSNEGFRDVYWESKLFKEFSVSKGEDITESMWDGATSGTASGSGSHTFTEQTEFIAETSYTRWFRIKVRGLAGDSNWAYASHNYSTPKRATIKSATFMSNGAGGYLCRVDFGATKSVQFPIDKVTIQYAITQPDEDMQAPSGISWTDARNVRSTGSLDAVSFPIDSNIGLDECLYVRVNTQHDYADNITYGVPTLVTDGVGYLKAPTIVRTYFDDVTFMAEIEATNSSEVPDSFLVIVYRPASDPSAEQVVGIIPHGDTQIIVQAPDWSQEESYAFGVYAAVGDPDTITRDSAIMKSKDIIWRGGEVPSAPTNVTATATSISGTVRVTWDWSWSRATGAELSWADHADAWESTDEPETYEVSRTHTPRWNISGLETGTRWYIRVRLISDNGDSVTYSPYSEVTDESIIDLTSAPSIPRLELSSPVITQDGSVTASWVYTTTDGTEQVYAEITEVTITENGILYGRYFPSTDETTTVLEDGEPVLNGKTYYIKVDEYEYEKVAEVYDDDNPVENDWYEYLPSIAHTETEKSITLYAEEMGWQTGETYNLAVRVISASGRISDDWSTPVSLAIAEPLTVEISDTSLVLTQETIVVDGEEPEIRTFYALTEMPLTITIDGVGDTAEVSVAIERSASYHVDRPDERAFDGYENETVFLRTQIGDGEMEIYPNDDGLIGSLDDTARYRIVVTAKDELGQTGNDQVEFEVAWDHQAIIPEGTVVYDTENLIARITPTAPTGAWQTDVCDVYRLSSDRPELVLSDVPFGIEYVDPYPAIGQFGGYRIVFKTENGDYITEDNTMAWLDLDEDHLDTEYTVIDYSAGRIMLHYNVDVSSQWDKDFQETKYLGGSIQGDWNVGVSRKATVNSVAITITDQGMMEQVRRLADTAELCHIRTQDGSSFACNVQVSETNSHEKYGMVKSYGFSITRVDPSQPEGMTAALWDSLHEEEA